MALSYVAYIDESGCDGFKFSLGSSTWLVLSAAVFRAASEPTDVRVVDTVRQRMRKPLNKDLHFRNLSHEQKILYASEISQAHVRCCSVAIHKPSIQEPGVFQVNNRLYHYAVRLLLERVSWLCAQNANGVGDGSAQLVFSHRRTISYGDLKMYLERLKTQQTDIDWASINPSQVLALPHRVRRGLWIADAAASAFLAGLEPGNLGFTEGRYATTLKPVVWHSNKQYAGTGIKIWPRESLSQLDESQHKWLMNDYGIKIK